MSEFTKIAEDLEHFASVVNIQAHRGYYISDPETIAKLAAAVQLLDEVSEDLCDAQEADETRQDTERYLNGILDTDALKASIAALSPYTR